MCHDGCDVGARRRALATIRVVRTVRVVATRSISLPVLDEDEVVVETLKFLSEPNRLRILRILSRRESCVCDLIEHLGLPRALRVVSPQAAAGCGVGAAPAPGAVGLLLHRPDRVGAFLAAGSSSFASFPPPPPSFPRKPPMAPAIAAIRAFPTSRHGASENHRPDLARIKLSRTILRPLLPHLEYSASEY